MCTQSLVFPPFSNFLFQNTSVLKLKIHNIKQKNHSLIARIKIHEKNIGHLTVLLQLTGMKLSPLRKGLCPSCSREPCVLGELSTQRMPNTPVRSYPSKERQPKHSVRVLSVTGEHNEGTSQALSPSQVSPPQLSRPSNTSFLPCPFNRNTHGT